MKCVLLFLAVAVFAWGLRGKLSQYHSGSGMQAAISSMAKLTTDKRSPSSGALDQYLEPKWAPQSIYLAAGLLALSEAQPDSPMPWPADHTQAPGQYNLHGPSLLRRPPPVFA